MQHPSAGVLKTRQVILDSDGAGRGGSRIENAVRDLVPAFETVVAMYGERVQDFGGLTSALVYSNAAINALLLVGIAFFVLGALLNVIQTVQSRYISCWLALTLQLEAVRKLYRFYHEQETMIQELESDGEDRLPDDNEQGSDPGDKLPSPPNIARHPLHTDRAEWPWQNSRGRDADRDGQRMMHRDVRHDGNGNYNGQGPGTYRDNGNGTNAGNGYSSGKSSYVGSGSGYYHSNGQGLGESPAQVPVAGRHFGFESGGALAVKHDEEPGLGELGSVEGESGGASAAVPEGMRSPVTRVGAMLKGMGSSLLQLGSFGKSKPAGGALERRYKVTPSSLRTARQWQLDQWCHAYVLPSGGASCFGVKHVQGRVGLEMRRLSSC